MPAGLATGGGTSTMTRVFFSVVTTVVSTSGSGSTTFAGTFFGRDQELHRVAVADDGS